MVSPGDPARLRHGLSPLTTSALLPHVANQLHTPASAASMTSPYMHSARTSIQPYNPQEWISPPPASSPPPPPNDSQAPAPPPPPYSPPRTRRQRPLSTAFDFPTELTSPRNASQTMPMQGWCSSEPQVRGFPPPPDAVGACSRGIHLAAPVLIRREEPDQLASCPDPLLAQRSLGASRAPPDPERMVPTPFAAAPVAPPAARRAVSASALDNPSSARSRSSSRSAWDRDMPLPPPPPGPPPPSGLRSQSAQSVERNALPIVSPPTRRPPPSALSSLGPVPPTPADWVDEDLLTEQNPSHTLTIDPRTAASYREGATPLALSPGSNGLLNRARAVRHDKTIIQRRTESRHRHPESPRGSVDITPKPNQISDIMVVADPINHSSTTPRSNSHSSGGCGKAQAAPLHTGETSSSAIGQQGTRNSTPRAPISARLPRLDTATSPSSLCPPKADPQVGGSISVAPRALPTPPPQTRSASSSRRRDGTRLLSDKSPASQHLLLAQSSEQFAAAAVERFGAFAEREAAASADAERVRLFADFIVSESRIRRERYSKAIGAMGSEIFDLTRDLFRPMVTAEASHARGGSRDEWTPAFSAGPNASPWRSLAGELGRPVEEPPVSASASASLPTTPNDDWGPNNANRAVNYMPSLSPILSMSVSENHDQSSSRGRPPSRWWESGSQGDQSRVFERSKRESKYMGVPKNQWVEEEQDSMTHRGQGERSGLRPLSDYPLEKEGRHTSQDLASTPKPLTTSSATKADSATPSACRSSKPESVDVSRLVTLPPPYPRHHPAVNNNHPELASMRSSVRSLSELAEIDQAKQRFTAASASRREAFSRAALERQQSLRANLQKEIQAGNLGYADAAAIEADSQEQETAKKKEQEKAEYEHFQNEVVLPLNDLLTGRISQTTKFLDDLSQHLFDNGRVDADMPQEEGDDRPELLEKLTLLKWIFEIRESLHRAIYDIISDRNRRYREVVVAPYRLSGNTEKLKLAEAFFAEDAAKRAHAYANEVQDRAQDMQTTMEQAIERGVALQLSAFRDIAPPLRQLLDDIPEDLEAFSIHIPASEMAENPSYSEHPLQYLYSLLQHAEKSTYQFIESHTNLLCLLHEVKETVVNAGGRVLATRVQPADGIALDVEEGGRLACAMRQSESTRLTDDLKEKVRAVQEQWNSALGDSISSVKERIDAYLLQQGGWDEALEESAGFGAI